MPTTIMLRGEERQRAVYRLRQMNIKVQFGLEPAELAAIVCQAINVPLPEKVSDQCAVVRRWLSQPPTVGLVPRPWVPLKFEPAMVRAIRRAEDPYQRFPGDGRGESFEMQRSEVPDVHPGSGEAQA